VQLTLTKLPPSLQMVNLQQALNEVAGYAVISSSNPVDLLGFAKNLTSPHLDNLSLKPDGEAVQVNLPSLSQTPLFAAISKNAISVSSGDNEQKNARDSLKAPVGDGKDIVRASLDAAIYKHMADHSTQSMEDAISGLSDEEAKQMQATIAMQKQVI